MEQKLNNDLFVGQTVWCRSLSGRRGDSIAIKETKISKVGNKYFEVQDICRGRFFKQTLKHDGGEYSSRYQVYLDKDSYFNEVEMNDKMKLLRDVFLGYTKASLDLNKVRKIHDIVFEQL